MIANMSPENGATMSLFPGGRADAGLPAPDRAPAELVALVEAYYRAQDLLPRRRMPPTRSFTERARTGSGHGASPAWPGRSARRTACRWARCRRNFRQALSQARKAESGFGLSATELDNTRRAAIERAERWSCGHGAVVIAAITSCTNTSNPFVMMAAGLLAQKAVAKGLKVRPYVKTSLAPGSRVVHGLPGTAPGCWKPLAELGFRPGGLRLHHLHRQLRPAARSGGSRPSTSSNLVAAAVLSGNRNFEGRVSPYTQANYLASPPLVVAYALAGTVDIDLTREPLGAGHGRAAGLPARRLASTAGGAGRPSRRSRAARSCSSQSYAEVFSGNAVWNAIQSSGGQRCMPGTPDSTYLQEPPFFIDLQSQPACAARTSAGRACWPAGRFGHHRPHLPGRRHPPRSAAGQYLSRRGRAPARFQLLRLAARQRPGDDARHLCQHPPEKPAAARRGRQPDRCTCPMANR